MAGRRTIVYIDGFNLYYGALRDRPDCKWLDPWAWSESLLSLDERLILVRYFTARVGGRAVDPEAPQRQEIYLRALSSRAMEVVVHEGHFETETEEWPLASDPDGERVEVLVSEEKGSDVNLATYLMFDAFEGAMDVAIVVSDDFDLEEPMVLARDAYGIGLCVVSPRRTRKLANAVRAESWRPVREEQLLATQFPELVVGSDGHEVFRPPAWRTP